jgi:hypothetical protein
MTEKTWCADEWPCATATALREQLAEARDNEATWRAVVSEYAIRLAEAREALRSIASHPKHSREDTAENVDYMMNRAIAALAKIGEG